MTKKFGKIFAEPNQPKSAEPRTEPKFRSLPRTETTKISALDLYKNCKSKNKNLPFF